MNTLHKILDAMWKQGISDIDFCKAVGINKSAVTDWKKGKTKSYQKYLPQIAEVLNLPLEYLLENDSFSGEPSLSKSQKKILAIAEQLPDDDVKKLIDYAELLAKASEKE